MKYTEKDNQFIRDNYKLISSYKIAEILKRKQGSISRKIRSLGLRTDETSQSLMKRGYRRCSHCKGILLIEKFYCKSSFTCKECAKELARNYHYNKYNSIEKYSKSIIKILTKRKKCSLIPEDIINQFNKQNKLCYYSGIKMAIEANKLETISVDRINPDLPYQKDNFVLCCHIVNLMKQDLQIKEFIDWCKKVCNFLQIK